MTRLFSVRDTITQFYECMENDDWENGSAYFETLLHHYKNRGKKIKELRENILYQKIHGNKYTNKEIDELLKYSVNKLEKRRKRILEKQEQGEFDEPYPVG